MPLVYFPEEVIALNAEVCNHPDLCETLSRIPPQEVGERLGAIATYCGVIVDGVLETEDDYIQFADEFTRRLIEKRTLIILH